MKSFLETGGISQGRATKAVAVGFRCFGVDWRHELIAERGCGVRISRVCIVCVALQVRSCVLGKAGRWGIWFWLFRFERRFGCFRCIVVKRVGVVYCAVLGKHVGEGPENLAVRVVAVLVKLVFAKWKNLMVKDALEICSVLLEAGGASFGALLRCVEVVSVGVGSACVPERCGAAAHRTL